MEALESQFAARMEALKNTVQSKTAVPTAQVYVSTLNVSLQLSLRGWKRVSSPGGGGGAL